MDGNAAVWVSWENHRRSTELAKEFNAKLFVYDRKHSSRIARYVRAACATTNFLIGEKPKYVFGQNPSIILALLLVLLRPFFGYVVIIDRHSNFRYGSQNAFVDFFFHLLSDYTLRLADFTIVTNDHLKGLIESKGGRGLVLQDKLPTLDLCESMELEGGINMVFICSFSKDEPVEEVIEAFDGFGENVHLYVTGNYKKNSEYRSHAEKKRENIHFTGFLSEKSFQSLIFSADALVVLTKNENTLTCGAYEGVALGKPLILSNTHAIRSYFAKGALYCNNDSESIRNCIRKYMEDRKLLEDEIVLFKRDVLIDWRERFVQIDGRIRATK